MLIPAEGRGFLQDTQSSRSYTIKWDGGREELGAGLECSQKKMDESSGAAPRAHWQHWTALCRKWPTRKKILNVFEISSPAQRFTSGP